MVWRLFVWFLVDVGGDRGVQMADDRQGMWLANTRHLKRGSALARGVVLDCRASGCSVPSLSHPSTSLPINCDFLLQYDACKSCACGKDDMGKLICSSVPRDRPPMKYRMLSNVSRYCFPDDMGCSGGYRSVYIMISLSVVVTELNSDDARVSLCSRGCLVS
jgi:hypothetical protein